MRTLTASIVAALLLASCETQTAGPDLKPIGDGLEFIGIAGVLAALIIAFTVFLRK